MYADDAVTGSTVPCWWVLDATYRRSFPIGPVDPGVVMNDKKLAKRFPLWAAGAGWLHKASTLELLAAQIRLDPACAASALSGSTRTRRTGVDLDFHRR